MDDQLIAKLLPRLLVLDLVVARGGFSSAARQLQLGKAVVSHHIRTLERELTLELFVRNGRDIVLTDSGRAFHARVAPVLAELRQAVTEIRERAGVPTGLLRVAAPVDFGRTYLADAIAFFKKRHPGVEVEAIVGDAVTNLVTERIDLSFRLGWPADSSLRARKLASYTHVLCASPQYLASAPPVEEPADLQVHAFMSHTDIFKLDTLTLTDASGNTVEVPTRRSVAANEGGVLLQLARQGAGLAIFPDFMVGDDIRVGRLVQLLPEHTLPSADVVAIFPSRGMTPPKVQAFVDQVLSWLPDRLAVDAAPMRRSWKAPTGARARRPSRRAQAHS